MMKAISVLKRFKSFRRTSLGQRHLLGKCLSTAISSGTTENDILPKKRLDVAIVGSPNAGKSQLLNILTQSSVAAVSRKRHTTRMTILGARTLNDNTQLVFCDTPGYMRTSSARKEGLDRDLMVAATSEMEYVDYSLLVVDAARKLTDVYKETLISLMFHALDCDGREEAVADEDYKPERPTERLGIVLNKVDLIKPKENLVIFAEEIGGIAEACIENYLTNVDTTNSMEELFPTMFYTDARKGEGTDDILNHLSKLATPCKVFAVESGESTILSPVERIEEVIREKIYRTLHREIPHQVHQVNRMLRERQGGILEIQQDIVVRTKSHHSIVAGRNLATIQQLAQRDLQANVFPEKKVVLYLHLKLSKAQHDRPLRADTQGTIEYRRQKKEQ
jgi:GTP-binding protein Era